MTRDTWNIIIIVAHAGLGIWLVIAGRLRYLHPENRNPLNPYLRLFWNLRYRQQLDDGNSVEIARLTRLIRGEAVWAMVSGAILAVIAVGGLIFGLLTS